MPNWCENIVKIEGKAEDIKTIYDAKLSFDKLHPVPDELRDDGWFVWCCNNWGTKWDIDLDETENFRVWNENTLEANFQTAWCPPTEFFEYLTGKMEGLEVKLLSFEPGERIVRETTFKEGNSIQYDIPMKEQKEWIEEHFGWEYDSDEFEDENDEEDMSDDDENIVQLDIFETGDADRPVKIEISIDGEEVSEEKDMNVLVTEQPPEGLTKMALLDWTVDNIYKNIKTVLPDFPEKEKRRIKTAIIDGFDAVRPNK